MQPKNDAAGRRRQERDVPPDDSLGEEPDFESEVSQATGKDDSRLDRDLNPIDDRPDKIDTHGSDR